MDEILNVSKAARRIRKAVKHQERIVLFSDSDMDGISSILILEEAIEHIGGKVDHMAFSNRERDGYGMALSVLESFREYAPALLVLTDLGIGNREEIRQAREMGFDVIVIDHHEISGALPPANIIVNPKQPKDPYVFKTLAACGLAMKVAERVLGSKATRGGKDGIVELAVLGTVADLMPLEQDNKEIVERGLLALCSSSRAGILALRSRHNFCLDPVSTENLDYPISILGARDRGEDVPGGYYILRATTQQEAKSTILRLERARKAKDREVQKVATLLKERIGTSSPALIFEEVKVSDFVLLGSIANILVREYDVPVFLHKRKAGASVGSTRAPKSFHVVKAMAKCKDLLVVFGGHPGAAGFRVENKNIEKFRECLYSQCA